jgi:hypothetical protein
MGKKSGFGIRDEQSGSYFRELRNNFWGYNNNFFMRTRDEKIRIRDGKSSDPESAMKKKFQSGMNIPDPQHWSRL